MPPSNQYSIWSDDINKIAYIWNLGVEDKRVLRIWEKNILINLYDNSPVKMGIVNKIIINVSQGSSGNSIKVYGL